MLSQHLINNQQPMKKKHLATISILVKDRHAQAPDINQLLTEHGNLVMSRLGVNLQRQCVEHCMALVTVVVEGPKEEINDLNTKLDEIYGIVSKATYLTD